MIPRNPETAAMRAAADRATLFAAAISLLTTVHHAYGAYVYNTPWRYHAAVVAALAMGLIAGSRWLSLRRSGEAKGGVARWVFVVVTAAVPFLMFGVFEGAYNHLLKDALYFAGVPTAALLRLFPPPTYEMPNDAFFEISGVLQTVPGLLTGYHLGRFVQAWLRVSRQPHSPQSPGLAGESA